MPVVCVRPERERHRGLLAPQGALELSPSLLAGAPGGPAAATAQGRPCRKVRRRSLSVRRWESARQGCLAGVGVGVQAPGGARGRPGGLVPLARQAARARARVGLPSGAAASARPPSAAPREQRLGRARGAHSGCRRKQGRAGATARSRSSPEAGRAGRGEEALHVRLNALGTSCGTA